MEIDATAQNFIEWISEITHVAPRESNGNYIFDIPISGGTKSIEVILSEFDPHLKKLSAMEEIEETTIYEKRSFEMLVREGSSSPFDFTYRMLRNHDGKFIKIDEENGITYILSRPSDEYLLYLIYRIAKIKAFRSVWGPIVRHRLSRFQTNEAVEPNIFEILRYASPRLMTLRLESINDKKANEFLKFSDAFLFQISYNIDLSLVPRVSASDAIRALEKAGFFLACQSGSHRILS